MEKLYRLEIRECKTDKVIDKTEPAGLRKIDKLEDAYNMRIDLNNYYTEIVEVNESGFHVEAGEYLLIQSVS